MHESRLLVTRSIHQRCDWFIKVSPENLERIIGGGKTHRIKITKPQNKGHMLTLFRQFRDWYHHGRHITRWKSRDFCCRQSQWNISRKLLFAVGMASRMPIEFLLDLLWKWCTAYKKITWNAPPLWISSCLQYLCVASRSWIHWAKQTVLLEGISTREMPIGCWQNFFRTQLWMSIWTNSFFVSFFNRDLVTLDATKKQSVTTQSCGQSRSRACLLMRGKPVKPTNGFGKGNPGFTVQKCGVRSWQPTYQMNLPTKHVKTGHESRLPLGSCPLFWHRIGSLNFEVARKVVYFQNPASHL